tara:strand:- start:9009 stop:9254 length:246 start_codon:yes stop_codon:yes gene_type:complete
MAFSKIKLDPTGSGSRGAGARAIYQTTDAKAVVKGAGYFNTAASELTHVKAVLVVASDATFEAKVSVAAGVVTLAAMDAFA